MNHPLLLRFGLSLIFLCSAFCSPICAQSADTVRHWFPGDLLAVRGQAMPAMLGSPRIMKDPSLGEVRSFNGSTDALIYSVNPLQGLSAFTIEVLFKPAGDGQFEQRFLHMQDSKEHRILMEIRLDAAKRSWALDAHMFVSQANRVTLLDRNLLHPADVWCWVAMVYDGKKLSSYVNGVLELEAPIRAETMGPGEFSLGTRLNRRSFFKGEIRELRVSPMALPPEDLQPSSVEPGKK